MAKARVGFYGTKGEALTRSHKSCPKCGPGIFLAEHANRRSCGKCGYAESKTPTPGAPVSAPAPKSASTPPKPKAPKAAPPAPGEPKPAKAAAAPKSPAAPAK
jgi:small subunit ribosomal protein S27Ae